MFFEPKMKCQQTLVWAEDYSIFDNEVTTREWLEEGITSYELNIMDFAFVHHPELHGYLKNTW